jgi:hypothetical protein
VKSTLPEPAGTYRRVWDLVAKVVGQARLTIDPPAGEHDGGGPSPKPG